MSPSPPPGHATFAVGLNPQPGRPGFARREVVRRLPLGGAFAVHPNRGDLGCAVPNPDDMMPLAMVELRPGDVAFAIVRTARADGEHRPTLGIQKQTEAAALGIIVLG